VFGCILTLFLRKIRLKFYTKLLPFRVSWGHIPPRFPVGTLVTEKYSGKLPSSRGESVPLSLWVYTGCKIKALRAKTNTYIKTPARGDEPVFVITGRREDVSAAKVEILSAADHFSQIRASRSRVNTSSTSASTASARSPGPTTATAASASNGNTAGHVTCEVRGSQSLPDAIEIK